MKNKLDPRLKLARIRRPGFDWLGDEQNGAFRLQAPTGRTLFMIASRGDGWEHVSVSVKDSDDTPTWAEMCWVKDLWFDPEETVIQYHPPRSKYINIDSGCLHLWRPQATQIPMPPIAHV